MKRKFYVSDEAEQKDAASAFIRTHGGNCHQAKYPCHCPGKNCQAVFCFGDNPQIFCRYIICPDCAGKTLFVLKSYPIGGNGRSMTIAACETQPEIDRALVSYLEIQREAGNIPEPYGVDIRIKNNYLKIEQE